MGNANIIVFSIIALVYSAIIHEYMHGWMAERLGDDTAKDAGRLTLNPIPHIDIYGSIILPALLILSNVGFVFGWAKPVPFNPNNLRDKKYGEAKVALAGPMGNLITAISFGLFLRALSFWQPAFINESMILFIMIIIKINIVLMIFNLMPIPPLDGSKVIMPFLSYRAKIKMHEMEKYGMIFILIFVMVGFPIVIPIIDFLFRVIVGA